MSHTRKARSLIGLVAAFAVAGAILVPPPASPASAATPDFTPQAFVDGAGEIPCLDASAAEFAENPGRFGWMGLLTCSQASAVKENVKLRSAWRWGPRQYWKACLVTVAVLIPLQLALTFIKTSREKEMATEIAVIKKLGGGQAARDAKQEALAPDEKANAKPAAAKKGDLEADDFQAPPQEKAPEQVVKITDDMVDKYMQSIPEQKEIDLSNVSVAKWDEDEVSGKTNPQNTRKPEDKIDPVKLDPTMLKDLESAKKTLQKDEGETGKKEGVDVAVQGKEAEGPKSSAGGDKKKDPGQLAGAISKDPRGTPSRITSKLDKNGLSIVSSARLQTQKPGQQRPLDPLEFYAGIKRAQAKPAAVEASGGQGGKAENRVVWQEGVPDADRDLVDQYFMKLRKEDR